MLFVVQAWYSSGGYPIEESYCSPDSEFTFTSDNGVVRLSVPSTVKGNGARLVYMGSTTGTHGISQLRH